MKNFAQSVPAVLAMLLILTFKSPTAHGQGTAFTYQGQLQSSGSAASGTYNLQFTLYTNSTGGTAIAGPVTTSGVAITNGLFTVTIDFGRAVWNGATNWLLIGVETNGGGSFSTLSPRQQLTPTPYAIFAGGANQLTGTAGTATNFSGNLNGDVTGTQSATVVSSVGGQSAANVAGGVVAANGATNTDFTGAIVKRDANGDFVTESIALDNAEIRSAGDGLYALRDYLLRADNNKGNLYVGDNFPRATFANGTGNTGVGSGAAFNDTIGSGNTAVGNAALDNTMGANNNTALGAYAMQANITGNNNTANGYQALNSDTSDDNVANGFQALYSNTSGFANVANGFQALYYNQGGVFNTANGAGALQNNTNGSDNVADGYEALFANTVSGNTAVGFGAMFYNTTGYNNVANGFEACFSNVMGSNNVANGYEALYSNINGAENTASGYLALKANTSGGNNTAIGGQALWRNTTGVNNTAVGILALFNSTTGNNNIGIGNGAGISISTGSGNIDIGSPATAVDTNIIRIGDGQAQTYIAGISGVTITPSGAAVFINSQGQLGTVNSSRRYKEAIQDMGSQSDVLLSLRPVAFRYKHDLDPSGTKQFGLIAEEVEKVAPELVLHDTKGQIYSVRYEQINAMLLNEFLKEHQTVEKQNAEIDDLKGRLEKIEQLVNAMKGDPK